MMTNDINPAASAISAHTSSSANMDDYFKALYQRDVVLQVEERDTAFDEGGSRKVILEVCRP